MKRTDKIVEHYVMNNAIIDIDKSAAAYNVIYVRSNNTGVIMEDVTLSEAYAFIAGYMYNRVKLLEK